MINLNSLRNKFIDKTVNVLNSVKYVPNKHDVALNAIIDNTKLSDAEKLIEMREYFSKAALKIVDPTIEDNA